MTNNPWFVSVLTVFPEMFPGPLGLSLPGKALKDRLWQLETLDIRTFAGNKHGSIDDTPYGGGAGMVMRPDVISRAISDAEERFGRASRRIYLSPRGRTLTQSMVKELAASPSLLLLAGRYEGVDQRAIDDAELEEVSVGDYVLAGGELAVMILCEACVRLLPGVLGNATTIEEESFEGGLLEYPHYTRPAVWNSREVPSVLLSGHHEAIRRWRREEAEKLTEVRRPDLWETYCEVKKKRSK